MDNSRITPRTLTRIAAITGCTCGNAAIYNNSLLAQAAATEIPPQDPLVHILSPASSCNALSRRGMPYIGAAASETLVGIFLEVLLTGAFLVVATNCASALYIRWRTSYRGTLRYLVGTFSALFLLIIMRTTVDLVRTVHSFSYPSDTGAVDLGGPASVESLMTNTLLVLITVVADIFLVGFFTFEHDQWHIRYTHLQIYRVHVVWEFNWLIIVLPILLCTGETAGGFYTIYALAAAGSTLTIATVGHIERGFTIFLHFTLVANLLCTLLIAGRIWWIRRDGRASHASVHDPVSLFLTLIVESAALYSAILIPEIVCIAYSLPARYVFINMIGPVVGIVFSYIIIRASRNVPSYDLSRAQLSTELQFSNPSASGGTGTIGSVHTGGSETDATRVHTLASFAPGMEREDTKRDAKHNRASNGFYL